MDSGNLPCPGISQFNYSVGKAAVANRCVITDRKFQLVSSAKAIDSVGVIARRNGEDDIATCRTASAGTRYRNVGIAKNRERSGRTADGSETQRHYAPTNEFARSVTVTER